MTIRALAEGLGISHPAVLKLTKKGMPVDSIEAAQEWRQRHIGHRMRAGSLRVPQVTEPVAEDVQLPVPPPIEDPEAEERTARRAEEVATIESEIVNGTESCRETLQQSRQLRKFAMAQVARWHQAQDAEQTRRWVMIHTQLSQRQSNYEKQLRDCMERDGLTLSYGEAERIFRTILQDIRVIAMAMPAALAVRVNPSDQHHAQQLLTEWVQKTLFKAIYEKNTDK
jgi:hypothetical protein